jgi:hypothetical protein
VLRETTSRGLCGLVCPPSSNQIFVVVEAKAMWKGPAMDLLRQVYEETQHQDRIEACGYRSATWRILRELKSSNGAKMMAGESAITAAPFFESAGRLSGARQSEGQRETGIPRAQSMHLYG